MVVAKAERIEIIRCNTNEFKICMSTFLCDTQPPALNACAVVGNETSQ